MTEKSGMDKILDGVKVDIKVTGGIIFDNIKITQEIIDSFPPKYRAQIYLAILKRYPELPYEE